MGSVNVVRGILLVGCLLAFVEMVVFAVKLKTRSAGKIVTLLSCVLTAAVFSLTATFFSQPSGMDVFLRRFLTGTRTILMAAGATMLIGIIVVLFVLGMDEKERDSRAAGRKDGEDDGKSDYQRKAEMYREFLMMYQEDLDYVPSNVRTEIIRSLEANCNHSMITPKAFSQICDEAAGRIRYHSTR